MDMSLRDMCLMYDEQFNRKMEIAKFLVKNLHDKKEKQLAKKWLSRVSSIKSPVLAVKKNRNAFLSYMVKVLGDGVLTSCLESEPNTVCDPDNSLAFLENLDDLSSLESEGEKECDEVKEPKKMEFHAYWSKDHRTYTAIKPIPGRGVLIYLASSKKPGIENWDLRTHKKTEK